MKKVTAGRGTGRTATSKIKESAKKRSAKSTQRFTFAELWQQLGQNYARNRRDIITAYGGKHYYAQIDALYHFGTAPPDKDSTKANNKTDGAKAQVAVKKAAHPVAKTANLNIDAYFLRQADFTDPDTPGQAANAQGVKSIILTNDLLTSEEKLRTLKHAYQYGVFFAILTLKLSPDEETTNWEQSSLFRPILFANIGHPHAGEETASDLVTLNGHINRYLSPFDNSEAPPSGHWQTHLVGDDEDFDNTQNHEDKSDSDTENSDQNSDEGDSADEKYDNSKRLSKRFSGLGSAASPHAYRLDTYQQFFSPFFHAIKHVPHNTRLLADFL